MAQTYSTTLIAQEEIAEQTRRFDLAKPDNFIFRAGQTIDLTIVLPSGEAASHTFSIVTAPHEDVLSVATRMRDSEYKNTLKELPDGAEVTIEGPYGSFLLHADETRPAIFLVGGIGITPFVSMIHDAKQQSTPHELYLLYSNRDSKSATFLKELTTLSATYKKLRVVPTMTDQKQDAWEGETGYITWEMVTRHAPVKDNPIFYMAGPEKMVSAMRTMLTQNGVSEDDIRFEEFSGY